MITSDVVNGATLSYAAQLLSRVTEPQPEYFAFVGRRSGPDFVVLATTGVFACGGHADHTHVPMRRMQPGATPSTTWPTVPLEWGNINFLHTTDTHGWLLGHLHESPPEPNYSGDFGDFASFVDHMRKEADRRGVDLLVIDSGDLHDGNGLSDGFPVGGVNGQKRVAEFSFLTVWTTSHELYQYSVSYDMHTNFAPRLKGRYLSSNVNITIQDKSGNTVSKPLGSSEACLIHQSSKKKITALGVMFEFTGGNANTTVQKVATMVNESWFKEAIKEEPDLFLLAGHMPVQKDKWPLVFDAIRAVHPTTPIVIFGGHTHIRDCVQLDKRSMSLMSGQYMETVGWMSADLDGVKNSTEPVKFSRRYLDANRNTYQFHTNKTGRNGFDTAKGKKITKDMGQVANEWNLTQVWGQAPQDYYLDRLVILHSPDSSQQLTNVLISVQYPNNASLLNLLAEQVLPAALAAANPERAKLPHTSVIDTGNQRFDVYAGPFTRNDQYTVSPYSNVIVYMSVPAGIAKQIVGKLNAPATNAAKRSEEETKAYSQGEIAPHFKKWKREQYETHYETRRDQGLTLGYVTTDVSSYINSRSRWTDLVLRVALELATISHTSPSKIISIVNDLGGGGKNYTTTDVKSWGVNQPLITSAIYEPFVKSAWA
ncbi:vacuolar protein [Rhizoctonia solani AG-1 IA]|uniref:Vacuolar protein n=1 Tax=Thanatephorus cucumeris (strain AG1-IA) TaxID=983506 RepID=L8X5D1_THACA|nr:vacuolar protein [Rhizoctonia solani AG-1 IA]